MTTGPLARAPSKWRRNSSPDAVAKKDVDFPAVAIGASAGGLDAFRTLLGALPAKSGMAFIVVQHLDPIHASMMVELLAPHVAMTVVEAVDAVRLEPDHVYVIPPGRYLAVRDGAIHLTRPRGPPTVRMPLDFLLRSLAAEVGQRAVCVILSGTASDGANGAKLIKEAGGLVIAQAPDEAEYDGMPRSAIAGGAVDLVLPLAKIPEALARFGGRRYVRAAAGGAAAPMGEAFAQIIDLLRKRTSHDFALYKEGTLGRRIERRMALNGVAESSRYLELLTQDPAELQNLVDDLLINVTRFFRDTEAFDLLAKQIIPELVHKHPPEQPIRVWVAGCSTGEEAYSLAMILLEEIARAKRNLRLQIFATDVDADAIAFAREGLYPPTIEADVPPARLSRFFTREEAGYRASRELRASIVFSVHDLVADAPFSRLDIVSCRNLLIYLRPEVQQKVISLFHFALREGAILFLGGSETVGAAGDRFEPISKTERLYRHIGRSRPGDVELPLGRGAVARSLWLRPERLSLRPPMSAGDLAQRLLLENYAPASVLVSQSHKGLYYFGPTDLYLKMPTGEASLDLLASAREGLRTAIRAAIEKASQGQERVVVAGRVKRNGASVAVSVSAQPVTSTGETLFLLSFVDAPNTRPKTVAQAESPADASRIASLEEELNTTRKDLEEAVRDREIAEEEIRAINEEAMSVNEEFQTTNEELETSHKELQSLNEELRALNNQLQGTLDQNRATSDDLENILNSSDIATVFLDEKLNIRFFTPAAKALFSVIASDVGRPLTDLAHHFANPNLLSDARAVLSSLVPITREVEAENAAWYNRRTLPYRTKDNRIEGVVITFVDVSARKRAEDASNAAKLAAESANLGKSRFLAAASHDLRQPLQTLSLLQGLLAKKLKDRDELRLVARSEEALTAMSGMLNTLLDINQLEAGVVRPEITDFPVNDLLERLKSEFAYHNQAKGLGWRVLPCRLAIRSDPRLLDQIIRNLLSNAVKYTKRGGLLLGCRRRGDKLRIEVWDTGLGIPEGQLRAIFEEFHQVDNPARELSRGLGLGLAIVQRLGDLLGLAVDVRSRVGMGSVFAVEVPLAPRGARPAPAPSEPEPAEFAARGASILIVEDDPALRESLELFLRTDGYVLAAAADGEEAIQLVQRTNLRPDLVIVDYNLPGKLTGLQVLAHLRGTLDRGAPALVLTGDISTESLREIAAQGFEQRSKPVRAEDLTRLVRRLLSERPAPATPQAPRSSLGADGGGSPIIFLVDDDRAVRDAMRDLLVEDGRSVESYANAEAFLDAYRPGVEGCLLVDAIMPGMGGFALLDRLKAVGAKLPAIMMTGGGDVRTAVRAMRAGAADFIEKPVGGAELIASINHTLAQTEDAASPSARNVAATERLAGLTVRQRQILDQVLAGRPSKIIAADLGISQRTVETHRAAIMHKTGAKSLSALVRLALAST
jgi:two-component system CheB/CheR fusion protein